MKTNESFINISEAEDQLMCGRDTAEELLSELENSSNDEIVKDIDHIIDNVKYIRNCIERALDVSPRPDSYDIEDWKDTIIQSLPSGASVAMANDVEAALENIKSVY